MPTNTTNYGFNKPNVNSADDEDLWGDQLNDNWDSIDALLKVASDTGIAAAKTANYTIQSSDKNDLIRGDASGGAFDFDLPAANSVDAGFAVWLIKTDSSANAITIDPAGSDTVDIASLPSQFDNVRLVSDGTSHWAASSANVESQVDAASDAEVIAGTVGNEYIPPKFFGDNQDLSSRGYVTLPGGLIIQWGLDAEGTVTFPTAFTTACLSVVATLTPVQSRQVTPTVGNFTTTTFVMQIGSDFTENLYWIAIGY